MRDQAPNPQDGRSYLVGLNTEGEAAHSAAAPLFFAAMERFEAGLVTSDHEARTAIQRIDAALRSALDLDDRPYSLADDDRGEPGGVADLHGPAAGRDPGATSPPVHRLHPEPTGLSPTHGRPADPCPRRHQTCNSTFTPRAPMTLPEVADRRHRGVRRAQRHPRRLDRHHHRRRLDLRRGPRPS